MAKADRVHSTPRRTASKIQPQKPASLPAMDPDTLPDLYCAKLEGDCLEPFLPDGASVALQKTATYTVGDIVCIWWQSEFIKPGMRPGWLKRIRLNAPPWVKKYPYSDHPGSDVGALIVLEQLNPPRTYSVPCSHIRAIHKAIGYIPAGGKIGSKINPTAILPIPGEHR
jgi:hypothetical protein